ncbi:MAG TPA: hypothetical protein VMX13_15590 [Sedimentisphaerales bacterium]|nr:hypothetical protein [Sedimentisphaerales bacterium]
MWKKRFSVNEGKTRAKVLFLLVFVMAIGVGLLVYSARTGKPSDDKTLLVVNQESKDGSTESVAGLSAQTPSPVDNQEQQSPVEKSPSGKIIEADVSLGDLDMPSASLLSQAEQKKAISFFEAQRRNWLAIRSGAAQYRTKLRLIRQGQFLDTQLPSQTGTLEFVVTPLDQPVGRQSPAHIQARLSNDLYKWNFVRSNVFDVEARIYQWADDPATPLEGDKVNLARGAFQAELLFFPFDFMAKTYPDERWNNRYMMSKEQYFADRGLPRRISTQEETLTAFGGEALYLFMASPALVDAHYWFSADNGELRQIDVFNSNDGAVRSYRYEGYTNAEGQEARFPTRFIHTWRKGTGSKATGWEYTVELTDVKLNIDLPEDRFEPR